MADQPDRGLQGLGVASVFRQKGTYNGLRRIEMGFDFSLVDRFHRSGWREHFPGHQAAMFQRADSDADGSLSLDEFSAAGPEENSGTVFRHLVAAATVRWSKSHDGPDEQG